METAEPVAYRRGGLGGSTPPPETPKALQNRAKLNTIVKTVKFAEFRTPTTQDVRKKGSKILKLPRFAIVLQGVTRWVHSDGKRIEGMMRMGEWRYNSKHPQLRQRLEVSGNRHASAAVDLVKVLPIASEWEPEWAPEPI